MQNFNKEIHQRFINYFKINKKPSETDRFLFEKTYKYIPYIKWIPGIKFIGVGNSTSMFTSNNLSDIDLFIITQKNRMWFVRILVTLIFFVLGVRKNEKNHEKRFCLSFFVTENGMDFSKFALENDIYLYFRIVYLKPILDFDNTYELFLNSQTWANFQDYKEIINENKNFIKFSGKSIGNNCKIFNFFDFLLKKLFLNKTLKNFEKLKKPYGIITNDDILKFHDNDKREEIKNNILNSN